jgi:tripartite-type tricarboxylate transporter receptor subunit TctC
MKRNMMNRDASWNAKGEKAIQERKSAGRGQTARRAFMAAGAIAGAVLLIGAMGSSLDAQSYPNKPIRLILPMATGGAADIVGRVVAQKLAERLGQPMVPENRAGAGGNIAYEFTAKARPDGYTLTLGQTALVISPSLYKKLNYDPIKDLVPISLVAQMPFLIVVRSSLPVNSLKELVEYAKANPGKLNYGSSGIGASPHLAGELLKSLAKINIVHVPYKGGPQMLVGLLGGEVEMLVVSPGQVLPQIQTGKVKALVVLRNGKERVPSLPTVPTSEEAGISNLEVAAWYGILAPAGTPRDIVDRLNAEWVRSEAMPDTREQLQNAGLDSLSSTPEQFSEFIKTLTMRWAKVIKEANIPRID